MINNIIWRKYGSNNISFNWGYCWRLNSYLMNISKKGREGAKALLMNIQLSQELKEQQKKTGKII